MCPLKVKMYPRLGTPGLGTSLNLMHLAILNTNFHSYQLNNCNRLTDITKFFCCRFNASEDKSKLFVFSPNWLAHKFVPSNCLPPILSREIVAFPLYKQFMLKKSNKLQTVVLFFPLTPIGMFYSLLK